MRLYPVFLLCTAVLSACGDSQPHALVAAPIPPVTAPPTIAPGATPKIHDQIAPDSTRPGPYAAVSSDYNFGRITVRDEVSGGTYESDVHGIAWMPQNLPAGLRVPVLVWLHGRHQTCQLAIGGVALTGIGDDDCPTGLVLIESAPSYTGYNAAAERLATQGYVVLSIDLNDVNDHDNTAPTDRGALARAQLALEHLDRFRAIDAAGGMGFDALKGHLDFTRVGLMGHSRGGIGVLKAGQENLKRPLAQQFGIKALFGLAADTGGLNIGATDYEVAPGVVWGAAHGYCDGDASDFFSAFYLDKNRLRADAGALRFLFVPMGANHNYFNTEWTGTDDWSLQDATQMDAQCGSMAATGARDDVAAQQAQLVFFMTSFFRYFVGGETVFAPLWAGRTGLPGSLCPDGIDGCLSRFLTVRSAPPAERILISAFDGDATLTANTLGGSTALSGFSASTFCTPDDGGDNPPSGGHGCPADPTFSRIPQLALTWTSAGAKLMQQFPAQDLHGYRLFSLRMALDFAAGANPATGQDFGIVLTDASGRSARIEAAQWTDALGLAPGDPYASSGSQRTLLYSSHFPLAAFAGVDLARVTGVTLAFDKTPNGRVQTADWVFAR